MKRIIVFLLAILLFNCFGPPRQNASIHVASEAQMPEEGYSWHKLLDSAEWRKNYNFQMFNIHDTLWVFHSDGNWFSKDGLRWTKSSLPNAIHNLAFLDYIYFKGAMYGLGYIKGNIETFTFEPSIFKTYDFSQWQVVSRKSNLPVRFFYHPFVFQDKLRIDLIFRDKGLSPFYDLLSRDGVQQEHHLV